MIENMASSPQISPQQLQNEPALPPPPGVLPNFINPPSFSTSVDALEGVFVTLMLIALGIRIYVRTKITRVWGWDDCMRSIYQNQIVGCTDKIQTHA